MMVKQEERIKKKIARIRKELAVEKKRWGGFHDDSRGVRYLPPELFIKVKDYKGGLRYLQWFDRTFPDDCGYSIFLFEWTLILFKTGNLKEAEEKAYKTFDENNFLFDHFLEIKLLNIDKKVNSNWGAPEQAKHLPYSKLDAEFSDIAEWLEDIFSTEKFYEFASDLLKLENRKSE